MVFNEDSRVKIPAILHLTRLGYEYLPLNNANWCEETNIFEDLFVSSIEKLNPGIEDSLIKSTLVDLKLSLDNDDLGKVFFQKLTSPSGVKLFDFTDLLNNSYYVVTELTCKNGDDEFRPDITLLINGMPLVFIEVKKPNNKDGVFAEHKRIETRFKNKKFKKFVNLTQLMVFSNNMEYDDSNPAPIEGAFYASTAYGKPVFNYFREEEKLDLDKLLEYIDDETEDLILKDNNLSVIKHSPEFITNKSPNSPTNRICTSLFNRERLAFLLKYAFAYVNESDGIQKHVMRYPQIFATKAIASKLDQGLKKGIIWHTQGSGKTALTYYNVKHLTDYFQDRHITPKFYFIVDRLDLLIQSQREFTARGLTVNIINSRDEFAKEIKKNEAVSNHAGNLEITVVNIQKFKDDPNVVKTSDYNIAIQRVYFLDEVHRSYNPKGSFLANLNESDPAAIKIGLTGTPLLGDDVNSKMLFGDYIHKYYYNASIADGYTLRLIREEIETSYKLSLKQALEEIEIKQGGLDKKDIYAHHNFVEPMLDYIIRDFERSRSVLNDSSIGAMVICDSSDQAKALYELFNQKYANRSDDESTIVQNNRAKSATIVLHDIGSKDERKDWVEDFKAGKSDILFVYNMLLTGFDAKRLKKLYLGRVIRKHNLLQALTRVNRTYKDFRYGYVVDFADISSEFAKTNEAYFKELQSELGDEMETYSNLFKKPEEITQEIEELKDLLFNFSIDNMEEFSKQITEIQDISLIQKLKKALANAKSLYNLIRLSGQYHFLDEIDFNRLGKLYTEVSNHLDILNLKKSIDDGDASANLLNEALEDVIFKFTKINESELVLADKLKDTLRQTRQALASNFDQVDIRFLTLKEELERLFKKGNLSEVTQEEMAQNIDALKDIQKRINQLNAENNQLKSKYNGDTKFTRIHKRMTEQGTFGESERKIFEALQGVKVQVDDRILNSSDVMNNDGYFSRMVMPMVIAEFKNKQKFNLNASAAKDINQFVVNEYMREYNYGAQSW